MGSVVFRAFGCVILGIFTLFLTACPKPVSLKDFLEDEKIKEIIEKNAAGIRLQYEHPAEQPLILRWKRTGTGDWTSLQNDGTITISIAYDTPTIEVQNEAEYTGIKWTYNNGMNLASSGVYDIPIGTPPFADPGRVNITVEGTKNSKPYSAIFTIIVGP
jgi:hypothetical protein